MTTTQQTIIRQIHLARRYMAAMAQGLLELAAAALRMLVRLEQWTGFKARMAINVAASR